MKKDSKQNSTSAKGLFYNNKFLAVFSVAVAVVFWAIVQVNYSENITKTFTELPVTFENILKDTDYAAYISEGTTVNVTVSGKNYNVGNTVISKEDIIVEPVNTFVDSTGYKFVTLSARFVDASRMQGVEITKVSPSTVKVYFDREATDTFNVVARLSNEQKKLVEGEYVLGQPVPSVSVMEISGPQTVVTTISEVYFEAEIDEADLPLTESVELPAEVSFGISSKELASYLKYDAFDEQKNPAKITVPVYVTKEIPTEVKFVGQPAVYSASAPKYKISPSKVTVTYNPKDVQQIESFPVGTIDFRALTNKNNTFTFTLDETASANLADKTANEFTVSVDMSAMSAKKLEAMPAKVVLSGKADGYNYTARLSDSFLDSIMLVGPATSLEKITSDDLQIEINVSGIDPENEKLKTVEVTNISIQSEQINNCWVYGTSTALVTVEE